jgi:SCP-2 sterol transfer family
MSSTFDIRKYFNQDLPAALAANVQAAREVNARYQFVIVGPGGGEWTVDLTAKGPTCKPGKAAADCTVTLSDTSFRTLCEKPELRAMQFYMSGLLKVNGATAAALKLGKILLLAPIAPASKAAAPAPSPKVATNGGR